MVRRVGNVVGGDERGGGRGRRRWRYQGHRAMSLAVSTEPEIALKIAIGGETAVHNNWGDSYETRSALRQRRRQRRRWRQQRRQRTTDTTALPLLVSRASHDVLGSVDGARTHARNRYRRRNSSPALQQQRRQRRRRQRRRRWLQQRRQWTHLLPPSPYSLFPPCQRRWRRLRTEVPTTTTSTATTAVTMTTTAVATVGSLGGVSKMERGRGGRRQEAAASPLSNEK